MGVLPCGWPISIRVFRAGVPSLAAKNIAPISASAALDITDLIRFAVLSTAPLFAGIGMSLAEKKFPPARLRALGLLKYYASLCTARSISLLR